MTKDQITQILVALAGNPMAIVLIIVVVSALALLGYAQIKKDNFDLRTLVIDENGQISIHKFGQITALCLSSWGFVYLILYKEITEYYFMGYMAAWASTELFSKWISNKKE